MKIDAKNNLICLLIHWTCNGIVNATAKHSMKSLSAIITVYLRCMTCILQLIGGDLKLLLAYLSAYK